MQSDYHIAFTVILSCKGPLRDFITNSKKASGTIPNPITERNISIPVSHKFNHFRQLTVDDSFPYCIQREKTFCAQSITQSGQFLHDLSNGRSVCRVKRQHPRDYALHSDHLVALCIPHNKLTDVSGFVVLQVNAQWDLIHYKKSTKTIALCSLKSYLFLGLGQN